MLKLSKRSKICISGALLTQLATAPAFARDTLSEPGDLDLTDSFVHSECDEMRSVSLEYEPVRIEFEGVTGMFFPMALARLMLCDIEEKAGVVTQLRLTETELTLWQKQESLRMDQMEAMQETIEFLQVDNDILRDRLNSADRQALQWMRHPALWFCVGMLSTVAIVLATVRL